MEILVYMSISAKSRDQHFVSAQNALGSAMIAVAKSISFILDLKENDITSTLLQILGNAGKLMAGLNHQQSVMRRAFTLPGALRRNIERSIKKVGDFNGNLWH